MHFIVLNESICVSKNIFALNCALAETELTILVQ